MPWSMNWASITEKFKSWNETATYVISPNINLLFLKSADSTGPPCLEYPNVHECHGELPKNMGFLFLFFTAQRT